MCLAVPVRIVAVEDSRAVAEVGGVTRQISIALTPEVKPGDYVLLHTGYAIGVVDEAEALETLKIFEEMAGLEEAE